MLFTKKLTKDSLPSYGLIKNSGRSKKNSLFFSWEVFFKVVRQFVPSRKFADGNRCNRFYVRPPL